jgi:hypothetical protein
MYSGTYSYLTLIDLLQATSHANHLHYSGDFNIKGLQIAAYLLERYPNAATTGTSTLPLIHTSYKQAILQPKNRT